MTANMGGRILFALAMLMALHQAAGQLPDPTLPAFPGASLPTTLTPVPALAPPTAPDATAAACNFTPTWFPKKYENLATPDPLQLDAQIAAGWDQTGDPLRVGLSDAGVPKFYIGVNWFMLTQDKVPADCTASLKPLMCKTAAAVVKESAPAGRRLLQTAVVTKAVSYSVTWQLNNDPPTLMPPFVPGQGRNFGIINLASIWGQTLDGDYCLKATVTVPARSGTITMGGKSYDAPCEKLTRTIRYCFVKVASKPSAKVKWSSCNANFTVSVTDIKPRPQYAATTGTTPMQLFSVIVQVWGNATKDDIDDQRQDDRPTDFTFDSSEDIEIKDPLKNSAVFSTNKLLDGKYTLHVNLRLKSSYPSLNNLSGPTLSPDGSTTTYLGVPALNGEKGVRAIVYHEKSDVYGVTCPTDPIVKLPAPRTFQWSYSGEGNFTCVVDGKIVGKQYMCAAPFTYDLTDRKNHTLQIIFTDKCIQTIRKTVIFGAWGCQLDKRGEPPAPPPPPPPAPEDMGNNGLNMGLGGFNTTLGVASAAVPRMLPALWAVVTLALLAAAAIIN